MYRADMRAIRKANVKWYSTKQKGKRLRRRSPMQLVTLRLHDLAKLFRGRYGHVLPDDDAGRDDLSVAVHHLACLPHPQKPIDHWLELWAPWLTLKERKQIVGDALSNPQRWKADALAWRLRLTAADRHALGITTIGAIDENKAARAKRRRRRDRERKARLRRAKGIQPRKAYEDQSAEQAMPWIAEGISRRTWYRRRAKAGTDGTGPATA
jgi:hypothetical protein